LTDDEIGMLDEASLVPATPAFTVPSAPEPARPTTGPLPPERPRGKAVGRLVGTKEPVFALDDEPTKRLPEEPGEKPHPKHGGIADAGFIED
jgi:hypothetical protein